jgi:glycosyltransferase involved in cell wall biosynthesis
MRILLVGDYPADPRLGSAKVLFKLQEEFRAFGHHCDVLLADEIGDFPRNAYCRQALGPLVARSAVRRAVADRGPYDVIDAASAEGLWIARWRTKALRHAAVISRSNGLEHLNYRRMIDDHDAGLLSKPWTRRLFHPAVRLTQVAAAAKAADRLILLNDEDREFALRQRWKPEDAIDVVPHGVSTRFLAQAPPRDAIRGGGILFCGTWTGVKGVSYLADAFSRLVAQGLRANLTVLGGAVPAGDIRAAFPERARSLVSILERVPEGDVMSVFRTHDVLAWPSTYEGFGMVLIEAMSQRLPVVATPVGCARSVVVHRQTGLVVPPRDAAALADALAQMLADAVLRRSCADAAFARVREMSWTVTARRTLDVYARALATRRHVH